MISDKVKRKIVKDYLSGVKTGELARKHGIARTTVLGFVKRAGYDCRPIYGQSRVDEKIKNKIVKEYLSGVGTGELARKHGVSRTSVLNFVKSAGYECYPIGGPPQIDEKTKNKIVNDYINGINVTDLSIKYGISRPSIYMILKKANIKLN